MLWAIVWILLGAGSGAAILIGVRWHRPARAKPWLLMAAAITTSGAGDALYAVEEESTAAILYYLMFVFVAAAMLQFTRRGSLLVDRARLFDLLAATCAVLLVVWGFAISSDGRFLAIDADYVIGALLLLGVSARLVVAAGRNVSAVLLLVGSVGALASNIAYPLAPSHLTEAGFIMLYVAWGLAGLHPSMTRLTEEMPPRPSPWRGHWAALLGASVATPPLVLLIEALSGSVRDGVVIAVAGAFTLTLTITRLTDSVAQHRQALARERGLREASADLVAAADIPAVDEAVRAAVAQLAPTVRRIVVAVDDRQLAQEGLSPGASDQRSRSWWVPENDEGVTLVCPLWLEPLAVARPSGGGLVLTGRREVLGAAQDALEVLAGQAALALDRISLVEAVGRRDSDLYLRAVIRNTADLMLVIDEDQRIRYASPALHALLGLDDLSPLATLEDLVHPDDRGQVRRALAAEGDGTLFCALRRGDESQVLVEATYRDLREDRLVQGFVVTMRDVTDAHDPVEQIPKYEHVDESPAWVNRRSAQHKFRY